MHTPFCDVAYALKIIKFGREKNLFVRQATEKNAYQFWFNSKI